MSCFELGLIQKNGFPFKIWLPHILERDCPAVAIPGKSLKFMKYYVLRLDCLSFSSRREHNDEWHCL
jgi:hypothetical protein